MQTQTFLICESAENMHLLGRAYPKDGALICAASCSGIAFSFRGAGALSLRISAFGRVYFTLELDGVSKRVQIDDGKEQTVTIAKGLPEGLHTVRLVKASQFTQATAALIGITLQGCLLPAPAPRELIEFYGDSLLNGSNVLGDGTQKTNVDNTDSTRAFGYLCAQMLGADCNVIGCGGLGLSVGGVPFQMIDVFDKCGGTDSPRYDFARAPRLVVIELGANDGIRAAKTTPERYVAAVIEFLRELRARYGAGIPFVWVYGYHDNSLIFWDLTKKAIAQTGDQNLYFCRFSPFTLMSDAYHPQAPDALKNAEELATFLREHFYKNTQNA